MRHILRDCIIFVFLLIGTFTVVAEDASQLEEVHTGIFPFYKYAAQYDVWKYIPMDQGGRLIQLKVIGSEHDADVIKAIRSPGFFAPWGNPIRWDSLEKTEIEKSVWLNRWYFLPCFARQYYLTGDKSYLRDMLAFIRKWTAENPAPSNLTEYFATRKYNWRDMQVAWRVQNLAWCYFLGEKGLTTAEKRELFGLMETHAHVLLEYFGKMPLNENNHQSHGATAMLYAALLFPDMPEANALKEEAFVILNHHLDHAFYKDGNSVELTPGYYPFFVSVFRDAYLLCVANHTAPPPRCRERLKQFYDYLGTVAQPDGRMPPINDSTESDPSVCLRVLADLLGLTYPYPASGSHWFSSSDQGVMRDTSATAPAYAFLDAGPRILAHWHGGKLGFHLWYWDKAFIVDSGVSDYDDPLRNSWYVQPEAHNTVLVDGKGDDNPVEDLRARRPMAGSRILQWKSNETYDWAVMRHEGFQDRSPPVSWVRHFILLKGFGTLLVDQLESKNEHEYTWLFHLLPSSPIVNDESKSVYTGFTNKNLLLLPAVRQLLVGPNLTGGTISQQGRNVADPVVEYTIHASNVLQAYLFLPIAGNDWPVTRFNQTANGNTVTLSIGGGTGAKRVRITRTSTTGEDQYRMDLDPTFVNTPPGKSGLPRRSANPTESSVTQ